MNYQELQSILKTYQTYYGHTLQVKLNAKKEALQAEYDRIVAAEAAKDKSLKTDEVLTEASAEFDEVDGLTASCDVCNYQKSELTCDVLNGQTCYLPVYDWGDKDIDFAYIVNDKLWVRKFDNVEWSMVFPLSCDIKTHTNHHAAFWSAGAKGLMLAGKCNPFSGYPYDADRNLDYACTDLTPGGRLYCMLPGVSTEDQAEQDAQDWAEYVATSGYGDEPQEVAFVPEVSVYELAQQCSLSLVGDAYSHTLNWLSSGDFVKTFYGADALRDVRDFLWKRLYRQQRAAETEPVKCQVVEPVDYSKPFRNVEVVDLSVVENRHGVCQDYNCYFCKARATKLVNRVSNMSEKSYSDPVCSVCAKQWEPATKTEPEEAPVAHPEFTCTTDHDYAAASIQFGERLYCHVEPRYNGTYGAKSELTCDVDEAPLNGQACHVVFGQSAYGWHFCNHRLEPVPDTTPAHAYEGQVLYPDYANTHYGCYTQPTCDVLSGQKSDLPEPQDTVDNLLAGVSTESLEAIKQAMQAPLHYQQVRKFNLLDRASRCLDCAVAFCDGFLAGLKSPAKRR